jgi:hypothetical protein
MSGANAMRFLLTLYALMSIGFAVGSLSTEGVATALCILGASALAIMAGAGLRGSLEGVRIQKIIGPLITLLLMGVAGWLSSGFSWNVAGERYPGWLWVAGGFAAWLFCPDVTRDAPSGESKSGGRDGSTG